MSVTSINAALEWHTVATPAPGETVHGDRAVVAFADGRASAAAVDGPGHGAKAALAAAVDGLGHGTEAAAAARAAVSVLERSAGRDPAEVVTECDRALRHTRGAALSLASIDLREDEMTWVGVGNVEARLLRVARPIPVTDSLLVHGGIVGHHLPRLSVQRTKIARGDMLIFATDGIRRDYADALVPSGSCREIAERILQQYSLGSDDALVLVARYLAGA